MLTVGDIFSGGGGWSIGARMVGMQPVWAIEHDAQIAEVYRANLGSHVIVADAAQVDIRRLEPVDVLLASPPCQDHSIARSKNLPKRSDAEIGRCVIDYVRVLTPRFVMIENVEGWKRSKSFSEIFNALHALGYWTNVQVLNAADFGVPQTRRRLFLRASREGFLPPLPKPTAWRGWYEATEDLIPTLPESQFADWQLARLPNDMITMLVSKMELCSTIRNINPRLSHEPAATVTADDYRRPINIPKAFIASGAQGGHGESVTVPHGDAPMFTVAAQTGARQVARAFIATVQGGNSDIRYEREPSPTITSSHGAAKYRAWLQQGRVVAMTPRALARFQSFPDDYELPEKNALACKVIGNAVPTEQAKRLLEGYEG